MHLLGTVVRDMKLAAAIQRDGFARETPTLLEDPTPEQWEREAADLRAAPVVAWDIETPYKIARLGDAEEEATPELGRANGLRPPILRISFCASRDRAVSVPWTRRYLPGIQSLLRGDARQLTWNGWGFDVPVLEEHEFTVRRDRVVDVMWAWHYYQSTLERGLESVGSFYAPTLGPWKHRAREAPAWYNAMDALMTFRIYDGLMQDLDRAGMREVVERHVFALDPVLYVAGRRGVMVDRVRQGELEQQLTQELHQALLALQRSVPDRFHVWPRARDRQPPERPGFQVTEVFTGRTRKRWRCSRCGTLGTRTPMEGSHIRRKRTPNPCEGAVIEPVVLERPCYQQAPVWSDPYWDTAPFEILRASLTWNPIGDRTLKAYATHHKHGVGTDPKTGKPSLRRDLLERLAHRHGDSHPYLRVSRIREIQKALSQYVVGFAPSVQGLVHTTYTHAPSTLRLSSRAVNLQNVTHRANNRWSGMIRRTLVADPGHVFVEADSTAIEAVLVGWFSGDAEYLEAARHSIYALVIARKRGWDFNPDTVARIKRDLPTEYAEMKRTILGTNYGMSPRGLQANYPDTYPSLRDAERSQQDYYVLCPKVRPWQQDVQQRAHREGYLRNPWGYRHYFWDVFHREKGKLVHGADAKSAIAYLPQSSAAAFMKDSLLLVRESSWESGLRAHCTVHDAITLTVLREQADEAIAFLRTLFTRPIPQLDGLRIGCEIKRGENWGDLTVA